MSNDYGAGFTTGRVIGASHGSIGGTRHVFIPLKGNKNQLVYPTIGGTVKNLPAGAFKVFEGDFVEFKTDGTIYLLRTFKVAEAVVAGTAKVKVEKSGFRHKPFVGDKLLLTGAAFTTTGTGVTVTAVGTDTVDDAEVWVLTLSAELTGAAVGNVLAEADKVGAGAKMLVQNPNMQIPADEDFQYDATVGDDNYEKHRWNLTPCFPALCDKALLSPLPAAMDALNASRVTGWYKLKNEF